MASDAILKPFLLSWFPFLVFSSGLRLPSNVTVKSPGANKTPQSGS